MKKIEKLAKLVKNKLESAPGCHDWDHTERVLRNSRIIMARMQLTYNHQKFNSLVVKCAVILHDVARPEELDSNGKLCHASMGAKLAPEMLRECGFTDPKFAAEVAKCIKCHRFRSNDFETPTTIEQKILYDADKIDSLGAIGVARALHFSGRIGSRIHNSEAEALASDSYAEGDSAYREYLVKLRYIPSKMLTGAGRNLAAERADFTHKFFEQLNKECAI